MKLLMLSLATAFACAVSINPTSSLVLEDGREIVTDTKGLTMYVFDVDTGSESQCYDACAAAWPPLLIEAGQTVEAPLGTTIRKDGAVQVTLNGRPIYYFVGDGKPGDINGDGLQGVWHIIVK